MTKTIQFQTGIDCLPFPVIAEHRIIREKKNVQNGNRHLPKQVHYIDVLQQTYKQY